MLIYFFNLQIDIQKLYQISEDIYTYIHIHISKS